MIVGYFGLGGGVLSAILIASSNLTPLRLSGGECDEPFDFLRREGFPTVFFGDAGFCIRPRKIRQPLPSFQQMFEPFQPSESDRLPVGQAFPLDLSQCRHGSLAVGFVPVIPSKFKFARVLGQMLPADVMPRSHHAALEQREK